VDITTIIGKIDLDLLKKQSRLIDDLVMNLRFDLSNAGSGTEAERLIIDVGLAEGLLELLDNVIIYLDD